MRSPRLLHRRRPLRRLRQGATLIDVATGSMLLAVLLIPSVHLVGESQSLHQRLVLRQIILFEARELIEQAKVALSEPSAFDYAYAQQVDVRRLITVSDGPDLSGRVRASADTTLPETRLVTILVDVWYDENRNNAIDADEISQTLRTQWAQL